MKTTASLFTGGALFDIGAAQAGYEPIWGIEKDDKIAAVARLNDFPVRTDDVLTMDFSSLHRPDHLHASPPCPNFSIAKAGAAETELDIALAQAVCRALVELRPATFTLEQVVGYRRSKSFALISRALADLGYWWDATNLNAADFGVPQTRSRLWVRASRGLLMGYPPAERWQGWYAAIEDLIPTLPDSEFAPWQMARLPEEYKTFVRGGRTPRAFIVPGGNANSFSVRDASQPARTVESTNRTGNTPRAFVGRVVKMTVQALGRFQTVPDNYKGLTVKINGNGVPCLMAQRILETLS